MTSKTFSPDTIWLLPTLISQALSFVNHINLNGWRTTITINSTITAAPSGMFCLILRVRSYKTDDGAYFRRDGPNGWKTTKKSNSLAKLSSVSCRVCCCNVSIFKGVKHENVEWTDATPNDGRGFAKDQTQNPPHILETSRECVKDVDKLTVLPNCVKRSWYFQHSCLSKSVDRDDKMSLILRIYLWQESQHEI